MRPSRIWLEDDWIRAVYYSEVCRILHGLSWPDGRLDVLEYADIQGIIPIMLAEITEIKLHPAPYPEHDIQKRQFLHDAFDVVIADQVLEHVARPWEAIKQCVSITRRGGILIFGSPWVYPWHAAPKDYWRISRDAYQMMFDDFGVETIEIGGWGGREILRFALETDGLLTINRSVTMAEEARLFEIENDPDYALQIWAVGRKK